MPLLIQHATFIVATEGVEFYIFNGKSVQYYPKTGSIVADKATLRELKAL
jgi:hypothetical protein